MGQPVQLDSLTNGSLWHGKQRLLSGHSKPSMNRQAYALQVEETTGYKEKERKKKINALMKRGGHRGPGWAKTVHREGKQGMEETLISVTSTERH